MRHDGSKCAQRLFSLGISFNEWNKQKIACIIQEKEANEKKMQEIIIIIQQEWKMMYDVEQE